ncbi:TPA: hypothetical protein ACXP8N_002061 [Klebsiella variicola subsp. variicola]
MGSILELHGAQFTDERLPKLRAYPGLTDGSLALLDGSELASFDFSAVVTGIPNLAKSEATRLTGKVESDLVFTWSNTLGLTGSTPEAKFERTPKGGLHGILSQLNQVSGHRARFQCPGLMDYISTHQHDHKFALFMHYQVTRAGEGAKAASATDALISSQTSPSTNRLIVFRLPNTVQSSPAVIGLQSDKNGTDFTSSVYYQDLPVWGAASGFGALVNNTCRSWVMYRLHFVDIDASGLTYAELLASEQQIFNINFGANGKYAGDTIPTSPTLLP